MKLGIAFAAADFTLRPDEMAKAVEERGFESLLFTEHTHIPATDTTRRLMEGSQGEDVPEHFRRTYDLFVALSFAAAATRTLKLGTGVCLMAEREPIVTAKAIASLDQLSDGRFLFGVGAGWIPEETANHGIDPSTRWAVMDDHIRAMRTIWADDVAEYDGDHVQFGPLYSWPKPQQRPGPPILVGGSGKGAIRRVLEYGTEWLPQANMPAPDLQARIAALQIAAVEHGRADPSPSPCSTPRKHARNSTPTAKPASPAHWSTSPAKHPAPCSPASTTSASWPPNTTPTERLPRFPGRILND